MNDLFNSVISVSCGICCSNDQLCENCCRDTLKANGLSVSHVSTIKNLSRKWKGNGGFQYSDMYNKLEEISNATR